MWPTGSSRSSGPPAELSGRIAESPLPIPRLRSATGLDLLGERDVRAGARGLRGVLGHRDAVARGLGYADAARDDRAEDLGRQVLAQLALDVLGQAEAVVL